MSAKIFTKLSFTFLFGCYFLAGTAQNSLPIISNIEASVDTSTKMVTISYDVFDAEGEELDISLRISGDSGTTFLVPADEVAGDIGFPVLSGTGRQVFWTYDPGQLTGNPATGFIAKIIADDRHEIDIQEMVDQVDIGRLMDDLEFLSGIRHRVTGAAKLEETKDSLESWFNAYGFQTKRQVFFLDNYEAANIIGRWPGLTVEKSTVIVDGHYDTVSDSPGADDNGTGVTATLAAARILSQYSFRRSLKFIGFDLEEVNLNGSIFYLAGGQPNYEDIEGVLNMDMIGFTCMTPNCQLFPQGFELIFPAAQDSLEAHDGMGDFLTVVGNTPSAGLIEEFENAVKKYVPELRVIPIESPGDGFLIPDLLRSDHAPFWFADHKALFLTDGANFRNFNYHQPSDTIGTLDLDFFEKSVRAILATAAEMAEPIHAGTGTSQPFQLNVVVTATEEQPEALPGVKLRQHPNPFYTETTIEYELPEGGEISLAVFDTRGRKLKVLEESFKPAGKYFLTWDGNTEKGEKLPTGIYYLRLASEEISSSPVVRKMIILPPHLH